jgi:type 1 fimbria pilin
MNYQRRGVAWCGGILLLLAWPSAAQDGSAAPRGSYLQTCSQIHFNGTILAATCGGAGLSKQRSTINATSCDGDIWNKYGYLYCYARRGTWGQGRAIPRGSYIDSCGYTVVAGAVLQSQCKGRNGQYQDTSLELRACRLGSNISNIDGQLVCIN